MISAGRPDEVDIGALRGIAMSDIAAAVAGLGSGRRLVLVGAERHRVWDALRAGQGDAYSALMLAADDGRGPTAVIERLLGDLADLALARWPDWPGRDEAATPWMRAASKLAAAGRPPRLRRAEATVEFDGLRRAVDPRAVVLVAEVDPASPRRARASVDVLEWCAARGAPCVALLPHQPSPDPPYDRLLYEARQLRMEPEPVEDRFIASPALPHPASPTERRVKEALDRDAELAPLFACNQLVEDAGTQLPRVDLLWRAGRVVVELDGPEHQAGPRFAEDRHRDYELLVAGYHVLRITNDQVSTDLQRAVEKIRAVVRLRAKQALRDSKGRAT